VQIGNVTIAALAALLLLQNATAGPSDKIKRLLQKGQDQAAVEEVQRNWTKWEQMERDMVVAWALDAAVMQGRQLLLGTLVNRFDIRNGLCIRVSILMYNKDSQYRAKVLEYLLVSPWFARFSCSLNFRYIRTMHSDGNASLLSRLLRSGMKVETFAELEESKRGVEEVVKRGDRLHLRAFLDTWHLVPGSEQIQDAAVVSALESDRRDLLVEILASVPHLKEKDGRRGFLADSVIAAARLNDTGTLRQLLNRGADACGREPVIIAEYILKGGGGFPLSERVERYAEPQLTGPNALFYAIQHGNLDMVLLLLENGANADCSIVLQPTVEEVQRELEKATKQGERIDYKGIPKTINLVEFTRSMQNAEVIAGVESVVEIGRAWKRAVDTGTKTAYEEFVTKYKEERLAQPLVVRGRSLINTPPVVDISGSWKAGPPNEQIQSSWYYFDVDTQSTWDFDFKVEGDTVTGSLSNSVQGRAGIEGTVLGDEVSFAATTKTSDGNNPRTLLYRGKIKPDAIQFNITIVGIPDKFELTAHRADSHK